MARHRCRYFRADAIPAAFRAHHWPARSDRDFGDGHRRRHAVGDRRRDLVPQAPRAHALVRHSPRRQRCHGRAQAPRNVKTQPPGHHSGDAQFATPAAHVTQRPGTVLASGATRRLGSLPASNVTRRLSTFQASNSTQRLGILPASNSTRRLDILPASNSTRWLSSLPASNIIRRPGIASAQNTTRRLGICAERLFRCPNVQRSVTYLNILIFLSLFAKFSFAKI